MLSCACSAMLPANRLPATSAASSECFVQFHILCCLFWVRTAVGWLRRVIGSDDGARRKGYSVRNTLAAARTVFSMSAGVCAVERKPDLELRRRQINSRVQHAMEKFLEPLAVAVHRVGHVVHRFAP